MTSITILLTQVGDNIETKFNIDISCGTKDEKFANKIIAIEMMKTLNELAEQIKAQEEEK